MTATVAVILGLCAPLLVLLQRPIRETEALLAARVMGWIQMKPAHAVGTNVTFPLHGHFVGYTLTLACTVALLAAPFFLIDAGLMWSRRITLRQGLQALAVVTAILVLVNQLRLLTIGASMVLWGFRTGYERSHVLLGTTLSMIGVVLGVIVFLWLLAGDSILPERSDWDDRG